MTHEIDVESVRDQWGDLEAHVILARGLLEVLGERVGGPPLVLMVEVP